MSLLRAIWITCSRCPSIEAASRSASPITHRAHEQKRRCSHFFAPKIASRCSAKIPAWAALTFAASVPNDLWSKSRLWRTVDVKIAPDGERVAYVVSTPNLAKNEHEGALYLVAASGGASRRLGEAVRIFNTPRPAPQLRWSSDGTLLGLIGFSGDKPQVFAIPLRGRAPRALTDSWEGVSGLRRSRRSRARRLRGRCLC